MGEAKALALGIIHAYIAGVVGTINTGVARGRMQAWQVDNSFMKLFNNVIDMQQRLETSDNLDVNKLLPFLHQVAAQQTPQLSQVEDRVAAAEQLAKENPDMLKQILAKVSP